MRTPPLSRVGPSDLVLVALLAVATAAIVVVLPGHAAFGRELALHGALLVGFAALVAGAALGKVPRAVTVVASIGVVVTLYTSLGRLGFVLWGRGFDDVLSRVDRALLHVDHLHLPGAPLSRAGVEVMSLFYLLHIASVYVALAHHGLGRDAAHREEFLLGLVLTYSVAYAGYLLVPAHGPIAFHAADFAGELRGHGIHRATTAAVLASGGAIGAFPSLHVGGSLYLCLFDLRKNRLRAATYAPVVAMVALSTIYLRFHFVVDWLGGAAVALFAFAVTPRVLAAWSRRVPEEEPAS